MSVIRALSLHCDCVTQIKYQSEFWTGYAPRLIERLTKTSDDLEDQVRNFVTDHTEERDEVRKGLAIGVITALFCLGLGWLIFKACTSYNAVKADVLRNLSSELKDDLYKNGFTAVKDGDMTLIFKMEGHGHVSDE